MLKNILVTGGAEDIGQSIGKCLKSNTLIDKVIVTDINTETAAQFIYDEVIEVPRFDNENYFEALKSIIEKYNIDFIIPCTEMELRVIVEKGIYAIGNIPYILPNKEALNIGLDKFETFKYLSERGIHTPKTYTHLKDIPPEFPVILKDRCGSGSANLFKIENEADLKSTWNSVKGLIGQEFVGSIDQEFTCGLFRSKQGEVRHITYRRSLLAGQSVKGEVVCDDSIDATLVQVAEKLNLVGAINVQLRINNGKPCIFEINPRFSSTVRFRDLMGFQDTKWSIEDKLGLPISPYTKIEAGKKFYKGYQEYTV